MSNKRSGGSTRPIIVINKTLGSYHAQRAYERSFEPTSRALYLMTVVLRAIANDDDASKVEAIVDGHFEELQKRYTDEIARLERQCEESGLEPHVAFTKPVTLDAEISTPRANRYLGLIGQLDRIVGLIALLWLSGARSDSQYSAECYQWRRALLRLSNRIREISNRAIQSANRTEKAPDDNAETSAPEVEHDLTPVPLEPDEEEGEEATAHDRPAKPGRKKREKAPVVGDEAVGPIADAA